MRFQRFAHAAKTFTHGVILPLLICNTITQVRAFRTKIWRHAVSSSPRDEGVGRGPRRGANQAVMTNAPPLPGPLLHQMEEREWLRRQPRCVYLRPSVVHESLRLIPEGCLIHVNLLTGKFCGCGIPGEENDDGGANSFSGSLEACPRSKVRPRHLRHFEHALRTDHDVRQVEFHVWERAEERRIEQARAV